MSISTSQFPAVRPSQLPLASEGTQPHRRESDRWPAALSIAVRFHEFRWSAETIATALAISPDARTLSPMQWADRLDRVVAALKPNLI